MLNGNFSEKIWIFVKLLKDAPALGFWTTVSGWRILHLAMWWAAFGAQSPLSRLLDAVGSDPVLVGEGGTVELPTSGPSFLVMAVGPHVVPKISRLGD